MQDRLTEEFVEKMLQIVFKNDEEDLTSLDVYDFELVNILNEIHEDYVSLEHMQRNLRRDVCTICKHFGGDVNYYKAYSHF